jgi:NAD(P)-dependent dehydrogenase (short-subunit alcohol dehydrogenase family)
MSERALLITGGTGGLGPTVVARLARDYQCVVLFNSQDGLDALRKDVPALVGFQADLSDEASVRAAIGQSVARSGSPYGLVHLAGGYAPGKMSATRSETWQKMIGLNLTASFVVVRETLATMKRDAPGRIVAISSDATLSRAPGSAAYTISKSGLNLLIELTAAELVGTGITANALLPGTLDTAASRKAMPDARRVPLDSVAEAIAFLLSDAASSINGALIPLKA